MEIAAPAARPAEPLVTAGFANCGASYDYPLYAGSRIPLPPELVSTGHALRFLSTATVDSGAGAALIDRGNGLEAWSLELHGAQGTITPWTSGVLSVLGLGTPSYRAAPTTLGLFDGDAPLRLTNR